MRHHLSGILHSLRSKYFLYPFLFLLAFGFFCYLQSAPTFPDPDSFYHAKMAELIKDGGAVQNFPWLQFTTLKNSFIDQHFLYHVSTVPFIVFLDPLTGLKLATIFFAALLIAVFFYFLRYLKIKGALFYSFLLLVTSPFIFRVNLAKASSLSLIFLLIGLCLVFRRRYIWLAVLSFLYVWLYGGWPLILLAVVCYLAATVIADKVLPSFKENKGKLKLLLSCGAGLAAGLVINPYFPKNLFFYWLQTIQIGLVNYQSKIGVGIEWYPYKISALFLDNSLVFILFFLAIILFLLATLEHASKNDSRIIIKRENIIQIFTFIFLSSLFFLLTLKSRRYIEYLIPFIVIFSAVLVNFSLKRLDVKRFFSWLKQASRKWKTLFITIVIYFIFAVCFIVSRDIVMQKSNFDRGFSSQKFLASGQWLETNSSAGAIVFHSNWDNFPFLFYYNAHNYYIVGLDPTFMYVYNQDLYWQWVKITTGEAKDNLYHIIKDDFRASYVFIDSEHGAMNDNIKKDERFKLVYSDKEAWIYEVK